MALISGGCGIAPIVSLAEEIAKIGYEQEVRYIHTTQKAENEAFAEEIKKFAEEGHLKADIFYTRVNELPPNLKNVTYHKGHISPEFFKQIITQDMDCYIAALKG
ncbi:hypothetical protein FAI40_05370 [Acetobacteraceae bacterium]|nr:hypothetical protein FAI40_05370 [Acetobacteraceae bacterium]